MEKNFIKQTEDLESNATELSQLKSCFHRMQIELQTQHSKVGTHPRLTAGIYTLFCLITANVSSNGLKYLLIYQ